MRWTLEDLKRIPIFSALRDKDLQELSSCLVREHYARKKEIFSEGDAPDWFYIVMSGKVKVTKISSDGREIIIEVISPCDFFGGFAVLKGFPFPANAVAMETSEILKLSRKDILKVIDRFPHVMYSITSSLGERTRGLHETLKSIALERVESRIAALLIKLADKADDGTNDGETVIDMHITKQDIAEMVGTTVETAIRVMSRFRKSGFIADKSGRIAIKDMKALKALI
ncbi:MAG TPA: Crp/Fnr family transcriptional regulator [Dissulfurispiraceae bacterium]|nr:Crp/Fnr family transcriptional regulator [Dissulfurispiraceae bacterium]